MRATLYSVVPYRSFRRRCNTRPSDHRGGVRTTIGTSRDSCAHHLASLGDLERDRDDSRRHIFVSWTERTISSPCRTSFLYSAAVSVSQKTPLIAKCERQTLVDGYKESESIYRKALEWLLCVLGGLAPAEKLGDDNDGYVADRDESHNELSSNSE